MHHANATLKAKLGALACVLLVGSACASPPPQKPVTLVPLYPDSPSGVVVIPDAKPHPVPVASADEEPAPPARADDDAGRAALSSVQPAAIPPGFQISLERTACFGTCPVYSVTVRANGDVFFLGSSPQHGCMKRTASVTDVGKLVALVDAADFFRLKPRYRAPVTDHPWANVEVRSGARTVKVEHYLADDNAYRHADVHQRAGLHALEAAIDTVTDAPRLARVGPLGDCGAGH